MKLQEMYKLNKKATKTLFEKIKNIEGVELLEFNDGIRFKHKGHIFVFTAELEEQKKGEKQPMKTTEKKTESITIRITKETADKIRFNAEQERRKTAELVALWVEDVATVETMKKTDRGTSWNRPQYANIQTIQRN